MNLAAIERVKAIVAELQKRGARPEWEREMASAIPDETVAELVRDHRIPPQDRPRGPAAQTIEPTRPTGGGGFVSYSANPPGWNHIDRLLAAEDAAWRRNRGVK